MTRTNATTYYWISSFIAILFPNLTGSAFAAPDKTVVKNAYVLSCSDSSYPKRSLLRNVSLVDDLNKACPPTVEIDQSSLNRIKDDGDVSSVILHLVGRAQPQGYLPICKYVNIAPVSYLAIVWTGMTGDTYEKTTSSAGKLKCNLYFPDSGF